MTNDDEKRMAGVPDEETLGRLLDAACVARSHAYAPYSKYRVGAALLGADGEIYAGCNVENASYGLTMCAERVAMGCAVARGAGERLGVMVVVTQDGGSPCGACRQVMAEFAPEMVVMIAAAGSDKVRMTTVAELLPDRFELEG